MSEENISPNDNSDISKLQYEIGKLWKRARINAFAHRNANEEYRKKDSSFYKWTIITSLASILFIILSYIAQIEPFGFYVYNLEVFSSLIFSLLSIITAFFSLLFTIFSNHNRYGVKCEEHKQTQNSYIYIAQRTRESKKPNITKLELEALYDDLERDFAILKVRGIEPRNEHFEVANALFKKISTDEVSSTAQSFQSASKINDKPNQAENK